MLGAAAIWPALPAFAAKPITGPWPAAFPAKALCSNCGLCRSAVGVRSVKEACAFIGDGMARAERLEAAVHGRSRRFDTFAYNGLDEAHFGVHSDIVLARGFQINAQWTGVATGVALAWLESGAVDAVVVAGAATDDGFGAPKPILCRSATEVLQGRRVKPSLCPSLEVLDEVRDDPSITRLLFCGVGCAVQALRALGGASPEAALGLEAGGLFVLGTHCVDNSPTPKAAEEFVATLPGVGEERKGDVLAYEFMADFRVHARLKEGALVGEGTDAERPRAESVVKAAYMTLPPSIGIPSIAPSCFSCFDYTNGLADLVVGYMGAPFTDSESGKDYEMTTAPLMVTVRNEKGRAMLDAAVAAGRVQILAEGGHGGRALPSEGDRSAITMKTVEADSMVKSLTDPAFVAAEQGAPPWLGNLLASLVAKTLPSGMEFGRYSIDYHYLRNALYVADRMGEEGAARHTPKYAKAIMKRYGAQMEALRARARGEGEGEGGGGAVDGAPLLLTRLKQALGLE